MAGRHCIFCGRKGVSNEHIIAKRFRKLFVVPGDGIPLLRGTGDAGVVGMWQGPIFDAQVKRVCRDHCNNGWMRAMDDQVEAPLSRMMTGQRCELTEEEQNAIAAWSVRIAMLYQYRRIPPLPVAAERLDWFYRHRKAPPGSTVWLAASAPNPGYTLYSMRWSATRAEDGAEHNGVLSTLLAGHLVVQVFDVPGWERMHFTVPERLKGFDVQIWPSSEFIRVWPPTHALTPEDLGYFVMRFGHPEREWNPSRQIRGSTLG